MGQHKSNPNVSAVKRGEMQPKPKAEKAPSKREESFLSRWTKVIMARPEPLPYKNRVERSELRRMKREVESIRRQSLKRALVTLKARQKAARKAA
jgi:hypothetical protein